MKSEILKNVKTELTKAMKKEVTILKSNDKYINSLKYNSCITMKNTCRAIISMFPSINKKHDEITDDDIIKLITKYITQEKIRLIYQEKHLDSLDVEGKTPKEVDTLIKNKIIELGDKLTSLNIESAYYFLPKQVSKEDIIKWINKNINFSEYKNKMQAMKPIMKKFKGQIDGKIVSSIIQNIGV